jgi:ubiquinone/menaquinone biosynthesis C-methylase UbiE
MHPSTLSAVLLSLAVPAAAQDAARAHEGHPRDPQAYIAMLENPGRDAYQKPAEVVAALSLKPGEVIADVGSGSGYFTLRVAAQVGPQGRVYGVDIDPEMVRHLSRRVRDAGLRNVHAILADPADPLLPEPVDRFLIVDTWHHVEDQAGYLALMRRLLKPGGQVVMIDYQKTETPVGPPQAIRIARADLVKQMEGAGFRVAKEHTFLPYQYFLVFDVAPGH